MTVIIWCWKKIRHAYAACKRVISRSGGNSEVDHDQDAVYHVDLTVRAGEQNPSVHLQVISTMPQQRRRPDIQPIGMRRFADPEKLAAVFKACKELRVPIDDDRFKDADDDDGSGPAKENRKNATRTAPKNKNNIDNTDSQRR
ncbi:uncharacterized protein LOC132917269 isoform X2 [Rhopalosiphum padi]|uniref:uncharacterized protein LOC132917269 isoform X2 n=1 Tax=Rhopalosiphum padi TaxID=40932 RepID=UPI00298DAE7B|nr:uncharacterized protein LOC132917269 isoform X2 [Rhopalosiphum padi]